MKEHGMLPQNKRKTYFFNSCFEIFLKYSIKPISIFVKTSLFKGSSKTFIFKAVRHPVILARIGNLFVFNGYKAFSTGDLPHIQKSFVVCDASIFK